MTGDEPREPSPVDAASLRHVDRLTASAREHALRSARQSIRWRETATVSVPNPGGVLDVVSTDASMADPAVVFLDANLLLPHWIRSLFFSLAQEGFIRLHWTAHVLEEVRRNLAPNRASIEGLRDDVADALVAGMNLAFPSARIEGHEAFMPAFEGRVDAGDVHVAAGAAALTKPPYGEREVLLLTQNLRDLPRKAFSAWPVRPLSSDEFFCRQLSAQPSFAEVLRRASARVESPTIRPDELLSVLERSACVRFAKRLAAAWNHERIA